MHDTDGVADALLSGGLAGLSLLTSVTSNDGSADYALVGGNWVATGGKWKTNDTAGANFQISSDQSHSIESVGYDGTCTWTQEGYAGPESGSDSGNSTHVLITADGDYSLRDSFVLEPDGQWYTQSVNGGANLSSAYDSGPATNDDHGHSTWSSSYAGDDTSQKWHWNKSDASSDNAVDLDFESHWSVGSQLEIKEAPAPWGDDGNRLYCIAGSVAERNWGKGTSTEDGAASSDATAWDINGQYPLPTHNASASESHGTDHYESDSTVTRSYGDAGGSQDTKALPEKNFQSGSSSSWETTWSNVDSAGVQKKDDIVTEHTESHPAPYHVENAGYFPGEYDDPGPLTSLGQGTLEGIANASPSAGIFKMPGIESSGMLAAAPTVSILGGYVPPDGMQMAIAGGGGGEGSQSMAGVIADASSPVNGTNATARERAPLTSLPDALERIAGSDEAKVHAKKIAAAILNTYNKNATWGFLGVSRLKEKIGASESEMGYYCHEWAYAFADAANCENANGCFVIEVQQASAEDGSGRVHYWIKISSAVDPAKYIYVDDGFSGGYVHTTQPIPNRPVQYKFERGVHDVMPGREPCFPPPAYNANGQPQPRKWLDDLIKETQERALLRPYMLEGL